jgi:hypothetical protein
MSPDPHHHSPRILAAMRAAPHISLRALNGHRAIALAQLATQVRRARSGGTQPPAQRRDATP